MKRTQTVRCALAMGGAAMVLLAGCANLNDAGMATMASHVSAFAIVNEQLVQGEMTLFPDHSGSVALRSDATGTAPAPQPAGKATLSSCVGRLRYTSTTMGSVDLRCNDGSVANLRMALIGETRGYGYGQTASGLASLTFGMTPTEARAHLTVPPNRQLIDASDGIYLELR